MMNCKSWLRCAQPRSMFWGTGHTIALLAHARVRALEPSMASNCFHSLHLFHLFPTTPFPHQTERYNEPSLPGHGSALRGVCSAALRFSFAG